MALTKSQTKSKPALRWRSVSMHYVLLTMWVNFQVRRIHPLFSEMRHPTIPSAEYQRLSRHGLWRAVGCPPKTKRQISHFKFYITYWHLNLYFIMYSVYWWFPVVHCKAITFLKNILSVCLSDVQSASPSVCCRNTKGPVDCAVDARSFCLLSGLKVYWNLLNCVVRTWHIHFQSQHDIFLSRTALCHVKKSRHVISQKHTVVSNVSYIVTSNFIVFHLL